MAWEPLGWRAQWFAKIEPFPKAVLKHHYPKIKNLGDMTQLHKRREFNERSIDLLVGGTPCQSFSIAGLRKGLADPRGNLALSFLAVADRKRPKWVVWENVPGVLSSWTDEATYPAAEESRDDCREAERLGRILGPLGAELGAEISTQGFEEVDQTSDFDCFLSGLSQLGYGICWRILDAQYFGVPQRRNRVFVIGYLGDWRRAAAVLLERSCLSGNSPPSREKGAGASRDVARSLKASGGNKCAEDHETLIAHTLRGEGFDASEDGTGSGTPIIPIQDGRGGRPNQHGVGVGNPGDPVNTLDSTGSQAIAFGSKDSGQDAGPVSPPLRAGNADKSHPNAGVPPAVAYNMRGNGDGNTVSLTGDHASRPTDYTPMVFEPRHFTRGQGGPPTKGPVGALSSEFYGSSDKAPHVYSMMPQNSGKDFKARKVAGQSHGNQGGDVIQGGMTVRRLVPTECEGLQGFKRDYTRISWRKKKPEDCPDGPRYKALGNSMAVPVMRWIGRRIEMVEKLKNKPSRRGKKS